MAKSTTSTTEGASADVRCSALDAHAHGQPPGGGAARFESPKRDRRWRLAAAGDGLQRCSDTEGKGEGKRAREEAQLTLNTMEGSTRVEEAGW